MNKASIETAQDADLRQSLPAMQRSAQRARELAAQTGTAIVIGRHGVIEQLSPETAALAPGVQQLPAPYGGKP